MDRRDRFIAELREEARARGWSFEVLKGRAKGGHALLRINGKPVVLPSREIDPKTAAKIRKGLGL